MDAGSIYAPNVVYSRGEDIWRETASTGPSDWGPMAQQLTSQYHVHVLVFDPIGEEVRIWGD
jgi:hypothetical protein